MAVLPILIAPDPRLKRKSEPVAAVDDAVRTLIADMKETMDDADGLGLAAPQVGVASRVIVVDPDAKKDRNARNPWALINPEIIWASDEDNTYEEGCLSVPKQYAEVVRPKAVKIRYLDEAGQEQEILADDLLATVVQHEIDHLDGILFVDHLSSIKRNILLRKVVKANRQA